jgi:hypothetical protein
MKRAFIATLAIALLFAALPSFAANLYAILFANTEDQDIGSMNDILHMGPFLQDTAKATGLTLKVRVHITTTGVKADDLKAVKAWGEVINGWSKSDLDKELASLAPTRDDTVLFYYSGHGGRMSTQVDPWPYMALQNDELVDLMYPVDAIKKKAVQPRLVLAFGDCCNSYMDKALTMRTRSARSTAALKALFLGSSGVVIASGSVPGQYSLGGSDGGVFTNAYLSSAYNAMNTDWETVMKNAQILASRSSDGQQVPQYQVIAAGQPVPATATTASTATTSAPATTTAPASSAASSSSAASAAASSSATDSSVIAIKNGKASGSRKPGDSDYPFAELSAGSVAVSGSSLVVTLDLAELPKTLTFNDADVPDDEVEYDWGAYIDPTGSGNLSYEICLTHFKEAGVDAEDSDIVSMCDAGLWRMDDQNADQVDANITPKVSKNRITLTLANYAKYFTLGKNATVYFSALYYPAGETNIP